MASGQDAEVVGMEPVNTTSIDVEPAPAETEASQPQQEEVLQPGGPGDVPVPQPRYNESDDITQGVRCYYPGCVFKSVCWGKILVHTKNKHNLKFKSINGTYFHRKAMKVIPHITFTL